MIEEPYIVSIGAAYEAMFKEQPNFSLGVGGVLEVIFSSPKFANLSKELRMDLAEIILEGPPIQFEPGIRGPILDKAEEILGRSHPSVSG